MYLMHFLFVKTFQILTNALHHRVETVVCVQILLVHISASVYKGLLVKTAQVSSRPWYMFGPLLFVLFFRCATWKMAVMPGHRVQVS